MSWFDASPEQREMRRCPQFVGRPPKPERPWADDVHPRDVPRATMREWDNAVYRWQNDSWVAFMDSPHGGFRKLLDEGWEIHAIHVEEAMSPGDTFDQAAQDERAKKRRDQISRWADAWIAGQQPVDLWWPNDREAMLAEVAKRLREATSDGFLLRALEANRAA